MLTFSDFVVWLEATCVRPWSRDRNELLDLDSLDMIVLLDGLEDEFHVDVPLALVPSFRTLGDIYDHYCVRIEK